MGYRKVTAVIVVACALPGSAVALGGAEAGAAIPAIPGIPGMPGKGRVVHGTYSGAAGTLSYDMYVPSSSYARGKPVPPVPLIVALHGCDQSAAEFRRLTRFDQLAEAKHFIVVFPEQNSRANSLRCWNWFQNQHMQRGAGEPALIAGITLRVQKQYSIDPKRIYATGLSAGGAMASVMSATYPDVFAAIGVGSGCEYAATAACAGYRSADPEQAGKQAYDAMAGNARVVPVLVFQGAQDTIVPPVNAEQVVQQWQATDDWADNSARDGTIPAAATGTTDGAVASGHSYTVAYYSNGHGGELLQYWLVHGMGHAWSGGCDCEKHSDPAGPDETTAMYDFFMSHPAP